ncbi:MAG: hypothetical protein HY010_06565 [Acidobacteria bacterium]|nr:hypothetical protein [Acidobacteriota bacterium]
MSHRSVFFLLVGPILSVCLFAQSYDGPAQLPITTVASSMADTPAPGSIITVNAGEDLQAALNSVQCGNTIQIQAGATFTGKFRFPAVKCDDQHWIIVRTSSPDSALPGDGHRLTPCYAGVASLPGRPQYSCNNPQNVLAKLVVPGVVGPVIFMNGANHYRLLGLELTRQAGSKGSMTLVAVDRGGTADHIILDRSWLHGTAQDETQDGFNLSGTSNVAVIGSYFSDFHCTSRVGNCMEAHAISGGTGNYQDGSYKIENNFLESSAQSILFGGAAATTTPTDITIRFNHFFKPWQWMKGNVPYQGGDGGNPFIIRHALEFKNAVRVLIENNLVENTWGGFGETGYAILLTPKNQHTKSGRNVCPTCQVTDVTIRYTHIFHAGGGIEMETVLSGDGNGGGDALLGTRFSIHDVVMDDISQKYFARGRLFLVANKWQSNPLNTITIDHITGFPDPKSGVLSVGNLLSNPQMYGFVFTNSIVTTGKYPVWNSGGGDTNCAFSDAPLTILNTCFTSYTFSNNALLAAPSHILESSWPTGNFFNPTMDDADFVQCNNGNGGNYQLQDGSPYKNLGTDGKDLGADIVGLNAALAGVE